MEFGGGAQIPHEGLDLMSGTAWKRPTIPQRLSAGIGELAIKTPPENVLILIDAARTYEAYPNNTELFC